MLGWSGVCYQFYQIQHLQLQQEMIKIDGYPKYETDQESQLFIYSFPREDCIRLDELLKSITSKYVKIYGAQALRLIQDILDHHHRILEKKKFHGNLTSRNVWIVFDQWNQKTEGSDRFRCIFSKLKYKIHFTGYLQSPLNGNNIENECSEVAVDILKVLEYCQTKKHKKGQSKKEMNLEKMKLMLLPYAQEQKQLFEQIKQIFQRYPYNQEEQRFKDLDCEQYSKLHSRGGNTFKKAAETIKSLFEQQPQYPLNQKPTLNDKIQRRITTIMQEMQFWDLLPKIVKEVKAKTYSVDDLKKEVKPFEPLINNFIQEINGFKSYHYGVLLTEFQNHLNEEFGKVFKIEIKFDQYATEPHFINLFRGNIAQHMNDFDSFRSLSDIWLKNKKPFETKIFEQHKPYLMGVYNQLLRKEAEALVQSLL